MLQGSGYARLYVFLISLILTDISGGILKEIFNVARQKKVAGKETNY